MSLFSFTVLIETTQIKKLDKKLLVEKSQIFKETSAYKTIFQVSYKKINVYSTPSKKDRSGNIQAKKQASGLIFIYSSTALI